MSIGEGGEFRESVRGGCNRDAASNAGGLRIRQNAIYFSVEAIEGEMAVGIKHETLRIRRGRAACPWEIGQGRAIGELGGDPIDEQGFR